MSSREFAIEVVRQLKEAGFEAYWAGGCVRDLLLGIEPADFDVATSAVPQQIRRLFGHQRTLPVGAAFGVIIVLSPDRCGQVEVATFRSDASYSDGRRPDSVTFSTPELDAQRRDFTINGMFYDPMAERVIDFVGGRDDLQRKLVRAIGDASARIREDKLRMLRAVRIAARFGFEIEGQTYKVLHDHSLEAACVSGERLLVELRKTLETPAVSWAVRTWAETGLMRVLLPEVDQVWAKSDHARRILGMLDCPQQIGWLGRLSGLLWVAVGRYCHQTMSRLKERLRCSNDQAAALEFALTHQQVLADCQSLKWSQVQPLLVSPWIMTALELLQLRTHVGEATPSAVAWLLQRLAWQTSQLDPPALVTGQDLIAAGYKPNPKFKDWLFRVRCLQLDGQLNTKEQALEMLRAELTTDY